MNRRKFLGTVALAPLGFAFKNPFSGLFKQLLCSHPEKHQLIHPIYDQKGLVSIRECLLCGRIKKYPWVSYRVKYTTTLTPSSTMKIRYIDEKTSVC